MRALVPWTTRSEPCQTKPFSTSPSPGGEALPRSVLRANSRLRNLLDDAGVAFLDHSIRAVGRILPHVAVSAWKEGSWKQATSVWTSPGRTQIRVTLSIGSEHRGRSLTAYVTRRRLPIANGHASR